MFLGSGPNRVEIKYTNGFYKLLSHGHNVHPKSVSVGERNIIGLSYFFADILSGKSPKDAYLEEYLLIIDDPISSFDFENRVGILSFLKFKLSQFLEGNPKSRVLLMTHDLRTAFDLSKILEDIVKGCRKISSDQQICSACFELKNKELCSTNILKRQEYTDHLNTVYKYAIEDPVLEDVPIGNIMRQVLEAFSTFSYKKGLSEVSCDDRILNLLKEEKYIAYYKNLMFRLVLHGDSHKEDAVKTMQDFYFYPWYSETEKIRVAKDVLCFIFLLNRQHLIEHLKGNKDVEKTIEGWCKNILTNSVASQENESVNLFV